jgi:hypothetical protein
MISCTTDRHEYITPPVVEEIELNITDDSYRLTRAGAGFVTRRIDPTDVMIFGTSILNGSPVINGEEEAIAFCNYVNSAQELLRQAVGVGVKLTQAGCFVESFKRGVPAASLVAAIAVNFLA